MTIKEPSLNNFLKTYLVFLFIFFCVRSGYSQSGIVSGGESIVVGQGFVSYSIGQIDFEYFGNVSLGVQQPIYNFAPPPKQPQSITGFSAIPVLSVGGIYQISNVLGGNSGNPVVFTSNAPNSLNVVSNTLIPFSTGVYTVTASQLGNSSYLDATPILLTVTVVSGVSQKSSQLIVSTIPSPIVLNIGDSLLLSATATSGLAVSYLIDNLNIVSIGGMYLYALTLGNANLSINQLGDANYLSAPQVDIAILINDPVQPPSTVAGIFGSETVVPGTEATYRQSLIGDGYTYEWKFSPNQNQVTFIGGSSSPDATVKFNEGAVSGVISCAVYDANGNLIQYSTIPVNVDNTIPSEIAELSNQLPEIQCTPKPSDCKTSFIKSFSVGNLKNINSGCSPSGYGDFTSTGRLDSLFMGESYDASLESGRTDKAYFGVWIDYNKNGSFGDPGEFMGSSLSSDSVFKIPNLLIGNDPDYVGPRRLRVKMQTTGVISATQSCQEVGGEGGEIEDYLVFIQQADRLKAPNIITPNNDGKNDLFVIRGVNSRKENRLVIVNRWGDKLYERVDYKNDWDGKDEKGSCLPRGTYFYFFTNGGDSIQGFVEVITE